MIDIRASENIIVKLRVAYTAARAVTGNTQDRAFTVDRNGSRWCGIHQKSISMVEDSDSTAPVVTEVLVCGSLSQCEAGVAGHVKNRRTNGDRITTLHDHAPIPLRAIDTIEALSPIVSIKHGSHICVRSQISWLLGPSNCYHRLV